MFYRLLILSLAAIIVYSTATSKALSLQTPRGVATDKRIKTVRYNPSEVYKFLGHYGYQSIIEFEDGEQIKTVSIGDSLAWEISPVESRIFIKPIEQDATTNMTVITDRRLYHFELHAEETEDISDENIIFALRFMYPNSYEAGFAQTIRSDTVPDIEDPEVVEQLNFKYSIVGSESISPVRIFDDGEFTYFEFKDKNAEVPAFFYVDAFGDEAIINFRTRGDYIVVERVAPRFTLRYGPEVVCVFNEAMQMPRPKKHDDERTWIKKTYDAIKFW